MIKKVCILITVILLIAICVDNVLSKERKTLREPFNPDEALIMLYGGMIWKNYALKNYFKEESTDTGYITLAFESAYIENNKEKHVVISHITPRPYEEYQCHACAHLVGGAVFVKSKNGWSIESKSKIIGWSSDLFHENITLVKIGPDKYGVMLSVDDVYQGYETKYKFMIVSYNNILKKVLDVGFSEKPSHDVCGKGIEEQKVEVEFDKTQDSECFDIIVHIKRNEGSCRTKISVLSETKRYKYVKGKYKYVTNGTPIK